MSLEKIYSAGRRDLQVLVMFSLRGVVKLLAPAMRFSMDCNGYGGSFDAINMENAK